MLPLLEAAPTPHSIIGDISGNYARISGNYEQISTKFSAICLLAIGC